MTAYADTSFLVALFSPDAHRADAWRWWRAHDLVPLLVSRLGLFETENTLRAALLARRVTTAEQRNGTLALTSARHEGLVVRRETSAHRLYPEAHRLSLQHSSQSAFGALDILHVASARLVRADCFLTFDARQGTLAEAAGLAVHP